MFSTRHLFLLTVVLAGCDDFWEVTIPSADSTDPVAITSINDVNGRLVMSLGTMTPIDYTITDPDEIYALVSAVMDTGGAHSVTHSSSVAVLCDGGLVVSSPTTSSTTTQAGSAGDTVNNGVYAYGFFRAGDWFSACPTKDEFLSVTVSWLAEGEDFYGNTATHGYATATYTAIVF